MNSYMIIDGQWGSTGKGLIAGYLAITREPDAVVCNFGPNAGHTVVTDGGTVMTQMLPSAIISPSIKRIFLGPGAVIDPEILRREIDRYEFYLRDKEIVIHNAASIVHAKHKLIETEKLTCISSTCKGTGAAQSDKMMRIQGAIAEHNKDLLKGLGYVACPLEYTDLMLESDLLQIESAQGLELGINSGWFPHCTSRDVNVWQVLSDCAVPRICGNPEVIVSMRTYPIRVGNVVDKDGEVTGYSGNVYNDQEELTWQDLGFEPERTTVTAKIRRVFTWSDMNMHFVERMLNPDTVFLNFVNYLEWDPTFSTPETAKLINHIETETNMRVRYIGTGPALSDVIAAYGG